jgi:hypothetical protein
MRNIADVSGGNPIAVWSQFISCVSADNLLVAFYGIESMEERESWYSFVASWTEHETTLLLFFNTVLYLDEEELDAVGALSVWSRKLSNDRKGQSLDRWPKYIISSSSVLRKAR